MDATDIPGVSAPDPINGLGGLADRALYVHANMDALKVAELLHATVNELAPRAVEAGLIGPSVDYWIAHHPVIRLLSLTLSRLAGISGQDEAQVERSAVLGCRAMAEPF